MPLGEVVQEVCGAAVDVMHILLHQFGRCQPYNISQSAMERKTARHLPEHMYIRSASSLHERDSLHCVYKNSLQ